VYLLNVTIAGYGTGVSYPGSNQALKVRGVDETHHLVFVDDVQMNSLLTL
jgi:hypothetical protein